MVDLFIIDRCFIIKVHIILVIINLVIIFIKFIVIITFFFFFTIQLIFIRFLISFVLGWHILDSSIRYLIYLLR